MLTGWPSTTSAHPRSRGENVHVVSFHLGSDGSSPLTRGKLKPLVRVKPQGRLIPAHAGKTVSICIARRRGRAHPRSRGENPGPLSQRGDPVWLIPAHAGKTSIPHAHRHAVEAHPRSRGENGLRVPRRRRRRGSSPLTRGKHGVRAGRRVELRLIPAHAGKTGVRASGPSAGTAHPRSRGENVVPVRRRFGVLGSSPLTRGKRQVSEWHSVWVWLIPAHAGKTSLDFNPDHTLGAHPRSRGENHHPLDPTYPIGGSSPLTRGKPARGPPGEVGAGLIPAHAGKTELTL